MPKDKAPTMVSLEEITLLPEIQVRIRINDDQVKEYTAQINDGVDFDRIILVADKEGRKLLADGWHRYMAYVAAERKKIPAEVIEDHLADAIPTAIEIALRENCKHGLRMSLEDRRKAAFIAVKTFPRRSDKALGQLCGVSPALVSKIREKGVTEPAPRKKRETTVSEHKRALPGQNDTTQEPAEALTGHRETSPLMERVRTVKGWIEQGSMDFPTMAEMFETETHRPVLLPKQPEYVVFDWGGGRSTKVPVHGARVHKGDVQLAVKRDEVREAFTKKAEL